jgi:hypothetical protein
MTIDCIIWAMTGVYVGVIIGMFIMLCRIERDLDSMYDTAFDSGVAYEKETQKIAELIRENEPGVIKDADVRNDRIQRAGTGD